MYRQLDCQGAGDGCEAPFVDGLEDASKSGLHNEHFFEPVDDRFGKRLAGRNNQIVLS